MMTKVFCDNCEEAIRVEPGEECNPITVSIPNEGTAASVDYHFCSMRCVVDGLRDEAILEDKKRAAQK